jgi:hypothetical protein
VIRPISFFTYALETIVVSTPKSRLGLLVTVLLIVRAMFLTEAALSLQSVNIRQPFVKLDKSEVNEVSAGHSSNNQEPFVNLGIGALNVVSLEQASNILLGTVIKLDKSDVNEVRLVHL